jgi:hypothetical protein
LTSNHSCVLLMASAASMPTGSGSHR